MLYLYDLLMSNYNEHTQRIAKNTLMLYFRMFFMMLLGLFTSRIVLEALGENDYGIYNVVGGVVALFTMISGSLSTAVTRFITFELGKGPNAKMNEVYSVSMIVMSVLALVVVAVMEPAGLWFIEHKMSIEAVRIPAARVVLHFSLMAFVVNLMSVPQMALITAHEKMSAYAYIGVLDGLLRFGTALAISRFGGDRLELYSMLMTGSVIVVRMAYGKYCRRNFPESRFRLIFEKNLLKEMFSFAGWSFFGSISGVLRDQGGNILVNVFSGPAVNAARAIAVQLNSAILSFVTNFMTAVNPQITKSYASGDHAYMFSLMRKSSRMAYYLLFVLILPVLFNTEYLLGLWLKEVPEHSVTFVRLFLVFTLSESISYPLITAMQATGRIRNYQLVVGGLQLLNLPLSYVLLRAGCSPEVTVKVAIVLSQSCLVARLFMLRGMIGLSVRDFIRRIYLNVVAVTVVAFIPALLVQPFIPAGMPGFLINVSLCAIFAISSIFFVGCTADERSKVIGFVRDRIKK